MVGSHLLRTALGIVGVIGAASSASTVMPLPPQPAAATSQQVPRATPWVGPRAITRTTAELVRDTRADDAERSQGNKEEKFEKDSDLDLPPAVARPTLLAGTPTYSFAGVWPRAQPVTLAFTAATGKSVPDTMGAAGPRQFLLVTNQVIRSFGNQTGAPDSAIDMSLSTFFRPVGVSPVDPNVRYDRQTDKWLVGAISYPGNTNGSNLLLFAVSDTGVLTSTTTWTFFQFQFDQAAPAGNSGCSADYPYWGLDSVALYVKVGVISCPAGTTARAALFVIQKASLVGDRSLVVSTFRDVDNNVGSPVDNLDGAGGTGYFLRDRQLCRMINVPASPTLLPCVAIEGNEVFGFFSAIRHRGNDEESGSRVNGGDDSSGRLHIGSGVVKTGVLRGGQLWFASNTVLDNAGRFYYGSEISRGSRLGVIWWQIGDIDSGRPRVVKSGRFFQHSADNDVDQRNYWMPSIAVSGQGHMVIGVSAAGINEYANAVAVGRLSDDPPDVYRDPQIYSNSNAAYNDNSARFPGSTISPKGVRRWGDYSHTSMDPCDDMTMWTVQQYTATPDTWGLAVARVSAPPPAAPSVATPSVVARDQDSVEIQLKANQDNGRGFFDPGPGFACRLEVRVSGATVNSVRVVDSLTLQINLSSRGVSPGPLDFTITNPDGQSVTATALVRVP